MAKSARRTPMDMHIAQDAPLTGIDLIVDQDLLASVKDEFARAKAARGA